MRALKLKIGLVAFAAALAVPAVGTAPALAQEASPSPSPSATTPQPPPPALSMSPSGGTVSGEPVRVEVFAGGGEGRTLGLFARVAGETAPRQLRSAVVTGGRAVFEVRPDRRMGLYARFEEGCCTANAGTSSEVALDVTARATITAVRNRAFDYTFTGAVRPAAGQRVTLWRVQADGRRVLTAASTVRTDGSYGFDRRFTGSGRFGFQVDVAGGEQAAAGRSPLRPTVVH